MERQSNRVSEQQRCAPSLHFGRGPSALLLLALYRTRPLLQELFLLQIKPSAEPTTLHAERHCKQTIITYQHMKLSCNIQLEL